MQRASRTDGKIERKIGCRIQRKIGRRIERKIATTGRSKAGARFRPRVAVSLPPAIGLLAVAALGGHVPAAGLPTHGGATAHDEAVLESPRSAVPAGTTLPLSGKHFSAGATYRLRLVGALREYELREIQPDEDGTIALDLAIPGEVVPGTYQVVAVAADGDVVARLDLAVLAPDRSSGAESGVAASEDPAGAGHTSGARDDDIRIERSRSGAEWGVIGLLVGLAGGLGVGLLRRGR